MNNKAKKRIRKIESTSIFRTLGEKIVVVLIVFSCLSIGWPLFKNLSTIQDLSAGKVYDEFCLRRTDLFDSYSGEGLELVVEGILHKILKKIK